MATQPNPAVAQGPQPTPIQTIPPEVKFKTDSVPPAQYLYLQENDLIFINTLGNNGPTTMTLRYRYLTPKGEIKEGTAILQVSNFVQTTQIPFLEGWLLSLGLQAAPLAQKGQWAFAQIGFTRGSVAFGSPVFMGMIWEGYVPASAQTGWPGTPAQRITDGPGFFREVVGNTPAAGSEITELSTTVERWNIIAFRFALTASATVANRFVGFEIRDALLGPIYTIHSSLAQTAGQTITYNAAPGQPFYNDTNSFVLIPLPTPTSLKAAVVLATKTVGLQAGDQYAAPQYLISAWGLWDQ